MRKLAGYILVFVIGFAACAVIFAYFFGIPERNEQEMNVANSTVHPSPLVASNKDSTVAAAAAKVEKSVVNIDTEGRPITTGFPDFFGFGQPQEVVPKGQASGVIIRNDGYILTNNHVVENTRKVYVTLWNKKRYEAEIRGRDSKTDLAVIKIKEKERLPAAVFGDSSTLKVGDWVIAVGNALGLGTTVTVGVVSATDRGRLNIEGTVLENAIQTDAAINRGNSGGALADINGNIVGINTAIASTNPGGGSIGIGFAVPSNTARWIAEQIIKHGKVIRPWLGITYQYLDDETRKTLKARGANVPDSNGAWIGEVIEGSPADRAGLNPSDVIIKINGKDVVGVESVTDAVKRIKVGDTIELTVWHARIGRTSRVVVRAGEMPMDIWR